MEESFGKLQIVANRGGGVQEIMSFLASVEAAYNNLRVLDLVIEAIERSGTLPDIQDPASIILPHEKLQLSAVVIESPGFWEFLGSLNPLEIIRKYLQDRHERLKDFSYRIEYEREKQRIEIEKMRIEVIREKSDFLRSVGLQEDYIRKILIGHMVEPLRKLDTFQDVGMIEEARIVETTESPATASA